MTIVEGGGHQVGSFVAGKAEHDPLVAGTFILVAGGIDALRDICGLGMQVVGEIEAVPVEPVLLITDALDRLARGLLDLLADTGRPIAVSVSMIPVPRISPARTTRLVVVIVSHATRASGSLDKNKSTIASEIWSATLSG